MSFPIDRHDHRQFDSDFDGLIATCDIDRTYLATRFSSLKGLARIPFEFGIDKRDIAGMARLLKELRRGAGPQSNHTPLYFVSASPAQLRPVIQRKMLLDGLEYDGTTFKDWKKVVLQRRFDRLKEQVGYKVTALLEARRQFPAAAREVLIGDDLETDALAFAAYADLLAGRIPAERMATVLQGLGVAADDAMHAAKLRQSIECTGGVLRIYIRLERHEPAHFEDMVPGVRACRGAFQMALGLFDDEAISAGGVQRVIGDLQQRGMSWRELGDRLVDAVARGILASEKAQKLLAALKEQGLRFELSLPEVGGGRASEKGRLWLPEQYLR